MEVSKWIFRHSAWVFSAIGLLPAITQATTYYVGTGPTANDQGNGTSAAKPFATPQHAADLVKPGDTVLLLSGTDTNSYPDGAVMDISRSGSSSDWSQFKAAPGQHPVLRSTGWAHVNIHGSASYIRIEGLEIYGHAADIPLAEAQKYARDGLHAYTNGNGISIDGRNGGPQQPHHIEIVGNVIHDCPGGGVGAIHSDYLTIRDNIVYDNAWWSPYDTSGISIYQAWNYDDAPGYHNLVLRNQCFGNRNYIPDIGSRQITDGNGIIFDDGKNKQADSKQGPYRNRTLIANNLCYQNGGSGIHAFLSEHIDVVNNTCIENNQCPDIDSGQCFPNSCDDVKFINNILVGVPNKRINSNWMNGAVMWEHNLVWAGLKGEIVGNHDVAADPLIQISRINDRLKFTQSSQSPAKNSGLSFPFLKDDLLARPRRQGKTMDIGCLQLK